ncbi:MAG: SusC/RagA family TonB-linked outer membrane protein [Paludibacter sp.]|nr:SusC/RagA family TonB-linked outer membrane protein [Paludibacter sp.]
MQNHIYEKRNVFRYKWLFIAFVFLSSMNLFAQNLKVSGTVTDNNGEPIPGVSVVVKGSNIGTLTNANGNYSLSNIQKDGTLRFSFVGMKTLEIKIGNSTSYNIVLEDQAITIDDIVVVGYGARKKESVVGAISQVDNKALVQSGNSNITNAIAGKLVGVNTIQQQGIPGDNNAEITIRGLSSWNGSAPLTLVDGVERDFTGLDPNEISSISVLKDASATAVFGAKGANGVLVVTTKRGVIGKPKIEFSTSSGVMASASPLPKHVDSYTVVSARNTALMNLSQFSTLVSAQDLQEYKNPSTPLNAIRFPDVNYYDLLVKPAAPFSNTNFNISGGNNLFKYFCSLGTSYEGSYFRGTEFSGYNTEVNNRKYNYRINVDFNLTKSTTLSFNLGGDVQRRTGNLVDLNQSWAALANANTAKEAAIYPAWVLEQIPDPNYPNARGERVVWGTGYQATPLDFFSKQSFTEKIGTKLYSDIILNQQLSGITKGLSLKGKLSFNTYYQNQVTSISREEPQSYRLDFTQIGTTTNPWSQKGATDIVYVTPPPSVDVAGNGLQDGYYKDTYYELSLNYDRSFGEHNVTGLALINRQESDKAADFPYYNEGIVGRVTYDFALKYLLEVNVGYTGSERFGAGHKFGFFPSYAVGWVVSQEKFFEELAPWMNKLKFRYSDGLVGSDKASSRWLFNSQYNFGTGGYLYEDKIANPISQWEEARKRDLGVEIGVFNNLFTLSVDLYDEFRDKMLLTSQSVNFLVGNDFKDLNKGSIKKHGIEVELAFNKKVNKDFNYYLKGFFSFDENRVIYKEDLAYAPDYSKAAGKPISYHTGNQLAGTGDDGYFETMDQRHLYPTSSSWANLYLGSYKYIDYNGDGKIDNSDLVPNRGLAYPPIAASFSGGLEWKRFEFSFMFMGNFEKYIDYRGPLGMQELMQGNWYLHTPQLNYWTPTNESPTHSALNYKGADVNIDGLSWRSSDYVRLKEVYLSYNFNPAFLKRNLGISNLKIYLTGSNLLTFTTLIEGDPESKSQNVSGQPDGQLLYPQMKNCQLGLKLNF